MWPKDIVALMKDGLPELINADGEMLGYERVSDLILEVAQKSPKEIIDHFSFSRESFLSLKLKFRNIKSYA